MHPTRQPTLKADTDSALTPAVLLRGAALYLERHGWIQGAFFLSFAPEPFPPACSLGAINVVAHGEPVLSSAEDSDDTLTDAAIRAMRVFAAWLDPDYDFGRNDTSAIDIVGDWNDTAERTAAEVIDALRDAANEWDGIHPTRGAK